MLLWSNWNRVWVEETQKMLYISLFRALDSLLPYPSILCLVKGKYIHFAILLEIYVLIFSNFTPVFMKWLIFASKLIFSRWNIPKFFLDLLFSVLKFQSERINVVAEWVRTIIKTHSSVLIEKHVLFGYLKKSTTYI